MKQAPVPDAELRRAKDHLKGSLMLSLENTASRMSHLARQEIYFDRHFGLDETLAGRRARHGRRRPAGRARICSRTARWPPRCSASEWRSELPRERLDSELDIGRSIDRRSMIPVATPTPRWARIWSDQRRYETWLAGRARGGRRDGRRRDRPAGRGARASREARAFDVARIEEIEQTTQHDVIAFTTAVAEHVGPVGALAALRPDLLRRRRHRAGAADARGLRPDPQGHRRAAGGRPRRAPRSTAARR